MAPNIIVRPDVAIWTKAEFYANAPPFSIGLDGMVEGGTWRDHKRHYANFDHHGWGIDRLATRATCEQIYFAILQGFFLAFKNGKQINLNIFVNDCDEDVCMAIYCLLHRKMIGKEENGRLRRLVETEGKMDAVGGCLNIRKDSPVLEEMAWIFEPYRAARLSGKLKSRDPVIFKQVILDVCDRIHENIHGRGKRKPLEIGYSKIGGGPGWDMIVEEGEQARLGFINDGGHSFVSVHKRPDGHTFNYSIGRIGPDVPFDVMEICEHLNLVEGLQDSVDRWGGSDLIGGGPRIAGSNLNPERVQEEINKYIANQHER